MTISSKEGEGTTVELRLGKNIYNRNRKKSNLVKNETER